MFSPRRSALLLPMLAASAAMFLAACSSNQTGPTSTAPAMSQAEANAASDVVVEDAASQADGATATSSGADFSLVSTRGPKGMSLNLSGSLPWYATLCSPAPTVTVNGSTTEYVFTNCSISRLIPLETITRNGEVDVTEGIGSRALVFKSFEKSWTRVSFRTGNQITTSETRNGTRSISGDASQFTHLVYGLGDQTTKFETDYVHEDASTSKHERNWQSTFTADVASSIVADQPLPAGIWAISGASTWTRHPGAADEKSWDFTTTATNVHYNPACTTAPQFDSGTMTVTAVNHQNNTTSTFTITFTACGHYTTDIQKTVG